MKIDRQLSEACADTGNGDETQTGNEREREGERVDEMLLFDKIKPFSSKCFTLIVS